VEGAVRARRPRRLPVVLTIDEVQQVLGRLSGEPWMVAMLLYGGGLRLMEALRLRVKDMDFSRRELMIRDAKGNKDRVTVMPSAVVESLTRHQDSWRRVHAREKEQGMGRVPLPGGACTEVSRRG
jgi:site-specific recombinase XerD